MIDEEYYRCLATSVSAIMKLFISTSNTLFYLYSILICYSRVSAEAKQSKFWSFSSKLAAL